MVLISDVTLRLHENLGFRLEMRVFGQIIEQHNLKLFNNWSLGWDNLLI